MERYRSRLFGIAYRMLGDVDDARDLVQETFLRWHQAERPEVVSPEGWLVAVVTRLAIDRLRRAATERAAYTGTAGWGYNDGFKWHDDPQIYGRIGVTFKF